MIVHKGHVELTDGKLKIVSQVNFFILELVSNFINWMLVNATNHQHLRVEFWSNSHT